MEIVSDFFGYSVPWWMWGIPSIAVAGALFVAVSRMFGFRAGLTAAVGFMAAAAVALSHRKGKQSGWEDRKDRERRDTAAAIERGVDARNKSLGADPKRLRDDDGFKRR